MTKRIIPLFLIIFLVACGQEAATAVKPATVQTKTIPVATASSSESLTDAIAAIAEAAVVETTAVIPTADSHLTKNIIKQAATIETLTPAAVSIEEVEAGLATFISSGPLVATRNVVPSTGGVNISGETAVANDNPISQPQPSVPQPADNFNNDNNHNDGNENGHDDENDNHNDHDDGDVNDHDDDNNNDD